MREIPEKGARKINKDISFEENLNAIKSEFGPGEKRNSEIQKLFAASTGDVGLLLRSTRSFDLYLEKSAALRGLSFRIANEASLEEISAILEEEDPLVTAEVGALSNGIWMMLDPGSLDRHFLNHNDVEIIGGRNREGVPVVVAFDILTHLVGKYPESADLRIQSFFRASYSVDPFSTWDLMRTYESQAGEIDHRFTDIKGYTIATMFGKSPEEAMRRCGVIGGSEILISQSEFGQGVKGWLATDSRESMKWIAENADSLSQEMRTSAYTAVANFALDQGEIESARSYLSKIESAREKEEISSKIWGVEKNALQREISTNPVETISSIISGNSKYSDYWLEESVSTWLKNDAGAVNKWYEENWNSLSPEKTQYVAAAFAKEAVTLGDLATAKEWAERIQNPKTRERIEGVIMKADE